MAAVRSWIRSQTGWSEYASKVVSAVGFVSLGIILAAAIVSPPLLASLLMMALSAVCIFAFIMIAIFEVLSRGEELSTTSCRRRLDAMWAMFTPGMQRFILSSLIGFAGALFLLYLVSALVFLASANLA